MTKKIKIKKNVGHTRKQISGQDRHKRMEKAYNEWKSGKPNSLQELADKYHIHVPDISKYITMKIELLKIKNK